MNTFGLQMTFSATFKRQLVFLLIFLFTGLLCSLNAQEKEGFAPPQEGQFQTVQRNILGVYFSKDLEEGNLYNPIQRASHIVLNYFGYKIRLLNLYSESLPDEKEMKDYAAVFSWFETSAVPDPDSYVIWMEKQAKAGKKIILFGNTGVESDYKTGEWLHPGLKIRLMGLVGLEYRGNYHNAGSKVKLESYDEDMVGFEYMPRTPVSDYEWLVPRHEDVKTWTSISYEDLPNSESSIVVTSPTGAYVRSSFALFSETESPYRLKWILNPFRFFKEVLPEAFPVPDPTTKNGKRVFYSHIDGDAFHSPSRADLSKLSSEKVLDILEKYPRIPVGVSFIIAEIAPEALGNQRRIESARKIAALPNVELGTHTYNHPYKWRGKDRTLAYHPPYKNKDKTSYDYDHKHGGGTKKVPQGPFDYNYEIMESVRYINQNIAPAGKKVMAVYWTGDTNPPPDVFEILEKNNLLNINGGDSIMDPHLPSYSNTSSWVRPAGKHWQVHSSQSNENLFTGLWTRDFNGFENLLITFKNTDSPRRIAAANCYYHFYTGERVASIRALEKIYDWAMKQELSMVFPSEYIQMVNGFVSARVVKLSDSRFQILDRGQLNNFRIDDQGVDIDASIGVVSVDEFNGSNYISLDPDVPYPIIELD